VHRSYNLVIMNIEQGHKLTARQASRYDRGMSEHGTETLDRGVSPEVRDFWDKQIKDEPDANTRSSMMELRRRNKLPEQNPLGGSADSDEMKKQVMKMTDKQLLDNIEGMKKATKAREALPIEKDLDDYIGEMREKLQGNSIAPGEVLERNEDDWEYPKDKKEEKEIKREVITVKDRIEEIKADWSDYSAEWNNVQIKEVAKKLAELEFKLEFDQIRTLLELLIATGKTLQDILPELEKSKIDEIRSSEEVKAAREHGEGVVDKTLKLAYFQTFEIKQDYIQKFVFTKEFRRENEQEYDDYPASIEELAWQIIHSPEGTQEKWGINGEFPLLEMRIDKDNPEKSKYYINQSNMTAWVRDRMMYAYDFNPDAPQDFFGSVKISKRFPISLNDMFGSPGNYFKSEDGETKYDELYNEWIKEAWFLGTLRSWDAKYRQVMGDSEARLKLLGEVFNDNTLTKRSFNKNLFALMDTLSLNFEGPKKGDIPQSDNLLGGAINEIYLAYDALSDFDRLRGILGEGSSFFTKDGWMNVFKTKVIKEKVEASGQTKIRGFLGYELSDIFEKAFDKNGQITDTDNRYNFTKFVNHVFSTKTRNGNHELAIRQAMQMAVAEKYGSINKDGTYSLKNKQGKEDKASLHMAEVTAWSMTRVFGAAARNDWEANGYDFGSKIGHLEKYRYKMIGNGDSHGMDATLSMFKMGAVDFFRGSVTTSHKEGTVRENKEGVAPDYKTPLEVKEEMQKVLSANNSKLKILERELAEIKKLPDKPGLEAKQDEIDNARAEMSKAYQDKAGELEFRQAALSNYFDDHLSTAQKVYELIMGATEFSMEKYVKEDMFGVHFNRAEFQKDVQHDVIHPIRYMLKTYPDLNYNMRLRMLDQADSIRKHEPMYREMTLGEAMFGHELLNRQEFWLRDENGKPINMKDKNGRKMKGMYEIDYVKVQDDKALLWKQFFMTKIAADLHAHRKLHSPDSRFDINYYSNVIKAIESIPSAIEADEFSLKDQVRKGNFFNEQDMKWFRRSIKIETYDLFSRAFLKDILASGDKRTQA